MQRLRPRRREPHPPRPQSLSGGAVMPGLVLDGKEYQIPGLNIRNFMDDHRYALPSRDYGHRRTRWVRLIVVHTTLGIPSIVGKPGWENAPQKILPGFGPKRAEGTVDSWTLSDRVGGSQ